MSGDGPQPEGPGRREGEAATRNTPTTPGEHDLATALGAILAPDHVCSGEGREEPGPREAGELRAIWSRLNGEPEYEMTQGERETYERFNGSETWREIRTGGAES